MSQTDIKLNKLILKIKALSRGGYTGPILIDMTQGCPVEVETKDKEKL